MEELLEDIARGKGPPHVHYMHFSPPCQDLSESKKLQHRRFTGATLM
jgi:hypothetical protein